MTRVQGRMTLRQWDVWAHRPLCNWKLALVSAQTEQGAWNIVDVYVVNAALRADIQSGRVQVTMREVVTP